MAPVCPRLAAAHDGAVFVVESAGGERCGVVSAVAALTNDAHLLLLSINSPVLDIV